MLIERISAKLTLDKGTVQSPNLCEKFSKEDLDLIGGIVHAGYAADKHSRQRWERRTQAAMDLAMQLQKDKTFPWPGASNIAFPLVTIAALQFHSRAYPAILSGTDIVKCRVIGPDPSGEKTARAQRISTHMSYQVLEEDLSWEEQKDRLLINLPIVGCCFVKSYWDAGKGHRVDETVLAQDLVVDYWSKSVETSPRKTHQIPMQRNGLHSRILRGTFRDVRDEAWYKETPTPRATQDTSQRDNRHGVTPPQSDETTPFLLLEQCLDLDLDKDGYAEPYIITIEEGSQCVLRIVTGFDTEEAIQRNKAGEIIEITPTQYYTKYSFIPSPDGGIYDVGFGVLLGPLNESVNSILNQLVDAGTMSNTAGGFLARGVKVRGGPYTFAPLEWKRVDSSGDDLRKGIFPLPVREPSAVLFNLLSLLINYVNRVAGTTDPLVGETPGQNTPAETTRTMVQEGSKIYSAIFKRVWRAMKAEFRKGYILNGIYMPIRSFYGKNQLALREDYLGNPDEVAPSADPNIASDQLAIAQAQMLKQAAMATPGYNPEEVERRFLKALKIDAIDAVYPGVSKTGAPKDAKLQIQELKNQADAAWLQFEQQKFVATLQEERRVNEAEIIKILSDIEIAKANTAGDAEDRKIGMLNAMLGMFKQRNEHIMKQLDVMIKAMEVKREQVKLGADGGNVRGLAAASGDGASAPAAAAQGAGELA